MTLSIVTDAYYLLRAIDEGIKGLKLNGLDYGAQVGCVLVNNNGDILSHAHNSDFGGIRKHAEEIALSDLVGADLSGATLYLTAEPCNGNPFHTRKHCCEQIVDAGVERVVLGSLKPRYAGGADYLRQHGVEVEILENSSLNTLCLLLIRNRNPHRRIPYKIYNRLIETRKGTSIP